MPPVSGLATLHLVVKMAEDLIATIRLLLVVPPTAETKTGGPLDTDERPARNGQAMGEASVLRILRANPHANWRTVRDRTGLTEANAKRALTAARKKLRVATRQLQASEGA